MTKEKRDWNKGKYGQAVLLLLLMAVFWGYGMIEEAHRGVTEGAEDKVAEELSDAVTQQKKDLWEGDEKGCLIAEDEENIYLCGTQSQ